MSENDKLTRLKTLLASDLIRERQEGIALGAEMLSQGADREAVRVLLENVAQKDGINIVKEAARRVLDADDARHGTAVARRPDYIFAVRCRQGHVSYYDKRESCPDSGSVIRRIVYRDGRKVDQILLRCKTPGCNEESYAEVDCEGYR